LKEIGCTAVLIHWGNLEPTLEKVDEYLRWDFFSSIVVVANDCREAPEVCLDDRVRWAIPPRNIGFGSGCSFGASLAPNKKYAFLNADVDIERSTAQKCVDILEIPGIGISAPTLYTSDGRLQSGQGKLSGIVKFPKCNILPQDEVTDCEWVTGAVMFCTHEVLARVGFDGSYFLGSEDVDFCIRTREKGWRVVILPGARATHSGHTTFRGTRRIYYACRNPIWMSRRNQTFSRSVLLTLYLLRSLPRVIIADIVKRRDSHTRLMLHGLIDGWKMLPVNHDSLEREPIPSRWIDWNAP
jgi:GT2 family glycosyltransferase